ncbi:MAG: transposase, partial [Candidatus Acidiferrales bacterium]
REVEKRVGILRQFAACFTDYRNPDLVEHTVEALVAQRVYALALGYEDLNDHEELRNDPLLGILVEKANPGSEALAGKSTLNRLELTKETASQKERYKKVVLDHGAVDRLLVEVCTGSRRGVSFMATMVTIAIYRCTSSAGNSCCVRCSPECVESGHRCNAGHG